MAITMYNNNCLLYSVLWGLWTELFAGGRKENSQSVLKLLWLDTF